MREEERAQRVLTQQEREEREARRKRRADAFWDFFRFTKDGKPKSSLLISSFCYSILCLVVYASAYILLLGPLDEALRGRMSPLWASVLESVLPALIGTLVCCAPFFPLKEKRLVPAAYIWILLYAIPLSIALMVGLSAEESAFMGGLLLTFLPAPLISGGALSAFLYLRHRRLHPPAQAPVAEPPAWKRRKTL